MRLNSSSINARALNSAQRFAVSGAADVVAQFAALLDGQRTVRGVGTAPVLLSGTFLASAYRRAHATGEFHVDVALAQTIARNARGTARLQVTGDLYYTRNVYGFGGAGISLTLQGHVGIAFIEGAGTLLPLTPVLTATRKRRSSGASPIALAGDFRASAVRYGEGAVTEPISIDGMLEPSHIDVSGNRYVGVFGAAPVKLTSIDAGMRRQTLIGSLDFDLLGSGSGRIHRPTLAGSAIQGIFLSADFRTHRRAQGAAAISVMSGLGGDIYVRGEGQATLQLTPQATGYVYRHATGSGWLACHTVLDGARLKLGQATLTAYTLISLDGSRKAVLRGSLPLVVASASGTASALRRTSLNAPLDIAAVLNGEVLIPGYGDALLGFYAEPTGYAIRHSSGTVEAAIVTILDGTRLRTGQVELPVTVELVPVGTRQLSIDGDAEILLFEKTDGYLNITSDDITEQRFHRPATVRDFIRTDMQRDFKRTPR